MKKGSKLNIKLKDTRPWSGDRNITVFNNRSDMALFIRDVLPGKDRKIYYYLRRGYYRSSKIGVDGVDLIDNY